jgi:uncharacterized protein
LDPLALVLASLAVFLGGAVKGVVALGLPLVAIPLVAAIVGLKHAVALLVVPMVGANFVQSFQGGHFRRNLRQFGAVALALFLFSLVGTQLLISLPQRTLEIAIGLALIVMPLVLHFAPGLALTPAQRRWGDPVVGAVAGLLGGIAAYYGPPLMIYLLGMRLPKDEFASAISLLYWIAALGIFLGIYATRAADLSLLGLSVLMLLPAGAGMWLGQRVQVRLSEAVFRRLLIAVYLATGASFLVEAWI